MSAAPRPARVLLVAACVLPACNNDGGPLLACPDRTPAMPLVSAHRGGAAYAPENTLLAFANAARLGVDEIEMDTQLTADGVLVLIHDATLDRTTDCAGDVPAHTLAELQACDAAYWFAPGQPTTRPDEGLAHPLRGDGVRVPTLREVFAWHGTLGCDAPQLSIEIKNIPGEPDFEPAGTEVAGALVALVAEFGMQQDVVVQSFWPASLEHVKRLDPSLTTQFLTTTSTGQTAGQNLAWVVARGHDISAPNFDAPDLGAPYVEAAHAAGKAVIPYTVDRASDAVRLAELGVDGLITNFPGCVQQALDRPVAAKLTPGDVSPIGACGGAAAP